MPGLGRYLEELFPNGEHVGHALDCICLGSNFLSALLLH